VRYKGLTMRKLFAGQQLHIELAARSRAMVDEVASIDAERLLSTSPSDLESYIVDKYLIEAPALHEDRIEIDQQEVQIDVSHDIQRAISDRSRPFMVPGLEVTFHIPFAGEAQLFRARPSTYTSHVPAGEIHGSNTLVLRYQRTDHDDAALKHDFARTLSEIQQYLTWIQQEVESFNRSIPQHARQLLTSRRERLLKDRGLVAALGFPLRRRADAPATYVTPSVRRKVLPPLPPSPVVPFAPEPVLEMAEYEHILSIVRRMVHVMERSPHAFHSMSEPDLRQHFLVQLNGQYEGQATGETFNGSGKTDILVRVQDRNIFIAECKFWDGPQSVTDALTQVLRYATWRDAKLALLLFNRRRDFSAVLAKVAETVASHPYCKRHLADYSRETEFRLLMHHPDDRNRDLLLTVLVFDVPT
jgi:hypothetical protein